MARPDPTPPDASLFPIAPTYTADLDAKALDEIRNILADARAVGLETFDEIAAAVRATGRKIRP